MKTLYLDLETYCEVPIQNGTYAYAEKAEILIFAWAIDDEPVQVWDASTGEKFPSRLRRALFDSNFELVAHNSMFDRTVLRFSGYDLPIHRWRDTMIKALAHSLPGSLGELCSILGLPTDKAKDKEGRELVLLFCKPRPATFKLRRATRGTHPEAWGRFKEYARLDVEAMRAVDKKLPNWNMDQAERELWFLDQKINDRGVLVDLDLARAALRAVDETQKKLARRTQELTGGQVQAATQRDALLKHLTHAFGVDLPDMQQSTLERRINDPDLPEALRELLVVRLQASTSSTSKYKTLLKATNSDGRLRGTLQFNGAHRTGRWAGRVFQPQNLVRPTLKQKMIDTGIAAMKLGCEELITDNVMELASNAIRGSLIAPPGKKLVIADLSNIEGRVLAWLAGEEWKLQAFRDFDAGQGHDLYKLAYAKSFGIKPEDVTKDQRQVGKVQELALGYEGGAGAFVTFAAAYGIDLEDMGAAAIGTIPRSVLNEANSALAWAKLNKRPTFDLSDRAWVVCDSFKRVWRQAHPATVEFWKNIENATTTAVYDGKARLVLGTPLVVDKIGAWLRVRLPSGRFLCYPGPKLDEQGKLSYMGVNQYSRKWSRIKTYGGKLAENVTQAVSRDVLAARMPMNEAAGYEILLTIHDEIIAEAPDQPEYNAEHLAGLMADNTPWADGLPLAAAGFETYRYRKE